MLTRVLEPEAKNGYKNKTSGCNTVEQIITKYSQFCNKFLRCAIEILKGAKDGKDLKDIMKIVDMGKKWSQNQILNSFNKNTYL